MRRLEGKTALITGAAKGLGAAMAQRFAEEGATVIVNDLMLEDARNTAVRVNGHAVAADVSNPVSVAKMFKEISDIVPRLDILVNNAGISGLQFRDVDELIQKRQKQIEEISATGKISTFIDVTVSITDDEWRREQAIHVDGTFHCCREALKNMNTQMNGSIINIASVIGLVLPRPERVADLGEQAGPLRIDHDLLAAQLGQLPQQLLLCLVDLRRSANLDMHMKVTADAAA